MSYTHLTACCRGQIQALAQEVEPDGLTLGDETTTIEKFGLEKEHVSQTLYGPIQATF